MNLAAKKLKNRVAINKEGNGIAHFIAEDGTYNGQQLLAVKAKSKKVTRI